MNNMNNMNKYYNIIIKKLLNKKNYLKFHFIFIF